MRSSNHSLCAHIFANIFVLQTFSSWGKNIDQLREEAGKMLNERGVRNMPSNIHFLGMGVNEEDMPSFYKTFDAFVLPTRAEGIVKKILGAHCICGVSRKALDPLQ